MAASLTPKRWKARRYWPIAGTLAILVGSGAFVFWSQNRRVPGALADGLSAYTRQDWDQAAKRARDRLRVAADDAEALRLSARSTARQNRDRAAIEIYSRLELRLMGAEDYFLLGRALRRTGQDDLGLKALEASREAEPDRPEMLDELAQLYLQRQRPSAADALATRLAAKPGWEARGLRTSALAKTELGDTAGVVDALRRALQFDPASERAGVGPVQSSRLLLARSLLQLGQPAEARGILESAPPASWLEGRDWLLSRCFIQEKAWENAAAAIEASGSYRSEHPLEPEPAPRVGAQRCASCHVEQARAHLGSRHSKTFEHARDARRLPWPADPITDPGDPRVSHRFRNLEDGIRVETRVDNRVLSAVITYAFGSFDRFVSFVATDDHGNERMLRLSYFDSPKGSGWDLSTGFEPNPANRDEFLGPIMAPVDGLRGCLQCHTTNPRAVTTRTGPEAQDRAIGCEVCHGPGGNHVIAVEAKLPDLAIINPSREDATAINGLCGLCHSANHGRTIAADSDDPGSFRFQADRLAMSRCLIATGGNLHCLACHDPHRNSDRETARDDQNCLTCHGAEKSRCPISPTKGCVDCHMHRVWYQQNHSYQTDHRIRVEPKTARSR